MVKPAVIKSSN